MSTILPLKAFTDNYIWLIINDDRPDFICIDPGDAAPVMEFAKQHQRQLTHILLTHHHNDHIGGVEELRQQFPDCKIYGPHDPRILHCESMHSMTIGDVFFEILATPGHTSSHISYYSPQKHWLFCGDTLFSSGCGRVFDGTMEQLYESMQIFKQLPDATEVYCAHEYTQKNLEFSLFVDPDNKHIQQRLQQLIKNPQCSLPSTMAFEKKANPFLRTDDPIIQDFAHKYCKEENLDPLAVFTALRIAKNNF